MRSSTPGWSDCQTQQQIQLQASLLGRERQVCLDLDHVTVGLLDPTLASSEEVDQFIRQRRVAELDAHLPQPLSFVKPPPLATSSFSASSISERRQFVERGISVGLEDVHNCGFACSACMTA